MRERCVLRFVVFSELSHLIPSVDSEVSSSLIALWSYFLLVERETCEVSQAKELGAPSSFRVKVG